MLGWLKDWQKKRKAKRWAEEREKIYSSEPIKTAVHESPSGRYSLEITTHDTGQGFWNFTKGTVWNANGRIGVVKRNYSVFPYLFVEDHPNGHDYLICGEDYQGQTIIELDTGKRLDLMSTGSEKGIGFCWAAYTHSPNKTILAVEGCVWGGPYVLALFDFSDPLAFVNKEIGYADGYNVEVVEWESDDKLVVKCELEARKSDRKPLRELTDEEADEADENDNLIDIEVYEDIDIRELIDGK